jgi:hypothetical protein
MLRHQTTPRTAACNDNGAFAALRVRSDAPRGILAAAMSAAGPISVTQLSEGVLIIDRARGHEPVLARRRFAH